MTAQEQQERKRTPYNNRGDGKEQAVHSVVPPRSTSICMSHSITQQLQSLLPSTTMLRWCTRSLHTDFVQSMAMCIMRI